MTIIAESLKALERNEKSIVRLESEEKSESFWGASWGFRFCFVSGLFSSYMIACYDDPFASLSIPRISPQVPHKKSSRAHNTTRTIARPKPKCVHHRETFCSSNFRGFSGPQKAVIRRVTSCLFDRHFSCCYNF